MIHSNLNLRGNRDRLVPRFAVPPLGVAASVGARGRSRSRSAARQIITWPLAAVNVCYCSPLDYRSLHTPPTTSR